MASKAATAANSISVAITGSGGAGVITSGSMLIKAAARAGFYGLLTRSVGPQIRGGEAASLLHLSQRPMEIPGETFDIVLAVDWLNFERFAAEIPIGPDTLVIADPEAGDAPGLIADSEAKVVGLPMQKLAGDIPGGRVNMIAVGAIAGLIGLPEDAVNSVIESVLAKKGKDAAASSIDAARAGMAAADGLGPVPSLFAASGDYGGRWIVTGNEAVGLGAIRGGVRFAAAYPITPATEVLEWLSPALAKVGGVLVQAEDELASVNMAIGASFGGVPSLTATSGPGLALMSESIGLASAAEIPIVVVDVMRAGPSTGIPTKSEQSDLNIAVYGQHGDAPHVVLAPMSVADCVFATQWAVHLAEALQLPAIVLSDQNLGQTQAVIDRPAETGLVARRETAIPEANDYRRYASTASGLSPMAIPGTPGGQYTAEGLAHNPLGTPSSGAEDHATQSDKRQIKLDCFNFADHWAEIEGEGELAVLTWGSSTGPVREALARAADEGVEARLISLRLILPVQPARLAAALKGVRRVLVVDQSHSGQFYRYLRAHYDLPPGVRSFHRPGPLPIRSSEILEQIKGWK